jgi:uncharacterized membrane protein (UPF0127 family)
VASHAGTLALARDDGRLICERVIVADRMLRRLRGLLGHRSIDPGNGIVLRPAFSIHTAFMRFPIDVVFLDGDQIVMGMAENLRPWKTATYRGARDVVELAAGECQRRGLRVGDRVAWVAQSADGTVALQRAGRNGSANAEPPVNVLIASRDGRFVRLADFLLDRRGFVVNTTRRFESASALVSRFHPDVVVIDASESMAAAARLVAALEAQQPSLGIVLVASEETQRGATALRPLPKWEALERIEAEVEDAHTRARHLDVSARLA